MQGVLGRFRIFPETSLPVRRRRVIPGGDQRMRPHGGAIGLGDRRQSRGVGEEPRHDRGEHRIRIAEGRAEQIRPAGAEPGPRVLPQRINPGDIGQRAIGGACAGRTGAEQRHRHRHAQFAVAGVHFPGDGARMRPRHAVCRPQARRDFGAVFGDGQRFPDRRALMFQIRHRAARADRLDPRRAAAGERDHHLRHVQPGQPHRQPAAQRPGGVAFGAEI